VRYTGAVLTKPETNVRNRYRVSEMRRYAPRLLACVALVAVATAAAATRFPAPATAGPTVTGGKASLAALRGKPVFINVWSSW
jgi:hypothetical protein